MLTVSVVAERSQPWKQQAACRDMDTAMFFPEVGVNAATARAVCADCLVRVECLEWALVHLRGLSDQGVWGGTTERDRQRIRRARRMEEAR